MKRSGHVAPRATPRAGFSTSPLLGRFLAGAGIALLAVSCVCFVIHARNSAYLVHATRFIFDGPGDDEAKAIALAHFVAVQGNHAVDPDSASLTARLENSLPLELSPVTVLKEGFALPDAKRFGPCGQLCRTVRAVAWLHGIRSHKVLMGAHDNEHAMVALYVHGGYRLFDPTYDFYWTDRAGHVATVEQVRGDSTIFAQVYRRYPGYKYRLDDAMYFNWRRLGRPGMWLRSLLISVAGRAWVESLDTPKLYDRPWWGYSWLTLMAGAFALATGLVLLRRTPSPPAATR